MPYNPGIQDISGQLIAQGMSQAGAARAQAIQSIGQSITGGIKQYQQNQFLTKQALGKFSGQMADPNFADFVRKAMADDPNTPISAELKTALKNVSAGKSDVYDAGVLAAFTDAYQDNLKGQLIRAQADAAKPKLPEGQIMSMADYRAMIAANPSIDLGAKVLPDGRVAVQTGGARAPQAAKPLAFQQMGGGVGAFNPETGELRRYTANVQEGMLPNDPRLLSMVPGQPATSPVSAPAPAPMAAPAVPAMLSRFQQAAEAPAGPVGLGRFMQAPAPAGPMATLGQFAGPPRAVAPAPAPAPATVPAPAPAPVAQRLEFKPIPGSKQDIERREAEAQKVAAERARLEKAQNLMFTLDGIEPLIGPLSVGFVGQKTKGQGGTPAANMSLLLKQVQAATAFDELAKLKESKTSLGQVAIKEIELLQNAVVALDQDMSEEVFRRQYGELRRKTQQTIQRLNILERDRQAGLTAPSEDYYKLGGASLEELNKRGAAATAPKDATSALTKGSGWRVK